MSPPSPAAPATPPAVSLEDAAATLSAAASVASAPAGAPAPDEAFGISQLLVVTGFIVTFLAQVFAGWVLQRYRSRVRTFMDAKARLPEAPAAPWAPPALLAGIAQRRRHVQRVLLAMVLVYAALAAHAFFYPMERRHEHFISYAITFLMFAAFCGPVMLLGVSASRFNHHFWVWFAPATFATVALQAVVTTMEGADGRAGTAGAMVGVVVLTVAAVLLRHWVPQRWALRVRAALARHGWKLKLPAAAVVTVALSALLEWVQLPALEKLVASCFVAMLVIFLCFLTMVDRIKRTLVPLLGAALLTVVLVGVSSAAITVALLPGLEGPWLALVLAAALLLGLLAANFMLGWIGLAYEQKVFSDAQFQVFSWLLAVSGMAMAIETLFQQRSLVDVSNLKLVGASLLALGLYWLVTRFGLQPLRSNCRLLVLRVFAQDSRGEQLMEELEYRWRFIGPIALIGGTDMATQTIDPAEAANFLRGRLKDGFVHSLGNLNRRIVNFDDAPDPDGRYRVNEFFCSSDLWQPAVQQLLDGCHGVLVDLRGFTAARQGTAWELALLRDTGALPRTVFLIDGATDQAAVHAALASDPGLPLPAARVLAIDHGMDGQVVVEALVHCLQPSLPRAARAAAHPGHGLRAAA